jgi:hypothetical protein
MQISSTHTNLKDDAEFYRWALYFELVELQEVRDWCVQVASQHPSPPQIIVEAALAKKSTKEALLAALEQVPGPCHTVAATQRLLALQYEYLSEDPGRLENVLMQLSYEPFGSPEMSEAADGELSYFTLSWYNLVFDIIMPAAKLAATKELHDNVLSFLKHAKHGNLAGYERKEAAWPLNNKYRGIYRNGMIGCLIALPLLPLFPALMRVEVIAALVVVGSILGCLHWQASRANKALERRLAGV